MSTPLTPLCAALPGAEVSQPFGPEHNVWKVGGKIFAALAEGGAGISVKTPSVETAEMLIAAGIGRKAPYFHKSWVQLPADTDPAELRHRIEASYRLIRASLPKGVQAALAPFP
jgi:predicted DNA-binding protein (MmcQ/YjbR family)